MREAGDGSHELLYGSRVTQATGEEDRNTGRAGSSPSASNNPKNGRSGDAAIPENRRQIHERNADPYGGRHEGLEPDRPKVRSRTVDLYQKMLLGGPPTLTRADLAERSGMPLELVREYLLAMGFQPEPEDRIRYTELDLQAFENWAKAVAKNDLSLESAASLTRAQSHLSDRLVLWEIEALVEDAERRLGVDDTAARVVVVNEMQHLIAPLEEQMIYAWRRQMYDLIERMTRDIGRRGREHSKRRFPLRRTLGFVDMVSYTSESNLLGGSLVDLVERFEYLCRTAVTAAGGRVVKMIGDSVLFIADDLEGGLRVVTELLETLETSEGMLKVRASIVSGDVFSRSGDVFGPPVNLAARLVDVAPVGSILTDAPTAAAIDTSDLRSEYSVQPYPSRMLRGLGRVFPFVLSRVNENRRREGTASASTTANGISGDGVVYQPEDAEGE